MTDTPHADGRGGIDAALVRRLLAAQFPQWSGLPVEPVAFDGIDNRTYRLGDDMTVRLPSAAGYAPAVLREHRWLPRLAPHLPVPIPEPLALGEPGEGYAHHWSVRRWIDGETADPSRIDDMTAFAEAVAGFITALQSVDAEGGPAAGIDSFYRGASPVPYDADTRRALEELEGHIDTAAAADVWDAALKSTWDGPPIWFHGDIAHGNMLVRDGRLAAVIDFGTSGVGDPACDLVIAWTMFEGASREAFRRAVAQDEETWVRARGWAIWKALILLEPGDPGTEHHRRLIEAVIAEHAAR